MGAVVSRPTNDACLPSTLLQHLTELTHLCLQHADQLLNADSLQHASCLVNLQELHITGSSFPLSHSTTPGWSRLTALRKVSIQRASLDPSILQDCTQLHGLALHWVNIVGAGGAAALLSLLGRLQQLKSLKFFQPEYDWPAAAYTSLTASSHLHELAVYIDSLPPGVWQCVFPSDRQLPALRDLTLSAYEWDESHPLPASASGTDDISRLASCCPGLHKITIDVQPGAQLSPLAKVSGLTSLSVSGLHEEGFESLRALSELVSLQELSVEPGRPITPQDLLRLTALTGLTRLCIDPHTAPEFEGEADVDVDLIQVCSLERQSHPPAWLQLLKHCGQFDKCQPLIFDSMGQQLAAQQQQIAELKAQLVATKAQAAEAAAAAAAAASAAAEAGELRGRLQALEGQMKQLMQATLHSER